ncbi:MAG: ROK family protein [Prevotella sp.]|nr:ROK family protein [Prevotella sp.]
MLEHNIKTKVVSVDIKLNITSVAIVDIRGNILATTQLSTSDFQFVGDYVTALSDAIITLTEQNGGYENIRSVGVSSPSGNFYTGCMENSPNLPWKGVIPLAAMMRDRLGLAVALANNAHVMALGERAFGAAHGMKDFILISLGTGLGSCIVSNGQVLLGANGFAGEIGHTCAVPGGRACGCGKQGCLEAYTHIKGLQLTAKEVMAESDAPSMMREAETITPHMLAHCCQEGDALAIETVRRTGEKLGIGLANYASTLNPEAIVFTGDVMELGEWLLEPTYQTFNEYVFRNIAGKVKFTVSTLDDRTRPLLGASVLAWEVKEYSLFK